MGLQGQSKSILQFFIKRETRCSCRVFFDGLFGCSAGLEDFAVEQEIVNPRLLLIGHRCFAQQLFGDIRLGQAELSASGFDLHCGCGLALSEEFDSGCVLVIGLEAA